MPPDPRTCGTCSLCCKVMGIVELAKPRNAWCPHCALGKGCSVYADRPASCAEFECIWLQSQATKRPLQAALRPDACKVVLSPTTDGRGVIAHVDRSYPSAWRRPGVREILAAAVADGRPAIVAIGDRRIWIDAKRGEVEVRLDVDETGLERISVPDEESVTA